MSDDKIVPFKPAAPTACEPLHVWQCLDCQCILWKLFCDGSIRCSGCAKLTEKRHFDPEVKS